jgi:hypothetical protein
LDKHVKSYVASTVNKPGDGREAGDRESGFVQQVLGNYKVFVQKSITLIECLLPPLPKGDEQQKLSDSPLGIFLEEFKVDLIRLALKKIKYALKQS